MEQGVLSQSGEWVPSSGGLAGDSGRALTLWSLSGGSVFPPVMASSSLPARPHWLGLPLEDGGLLWASGLGLSPLQSRRGLPGRLQVY